MPPPKPAVKQPTYSVVVNEVPVKELLQALARDTKQNIDIHPGLDGKISLNAINETLPAILERISNQVDLRYRTEGNTLIVQPDTAYMKTYLVNYVNIDRKTTSSTAASGQVGTGAGSSGGAASTNNSSTSVITNSNSDFWGVLEKSVKAILASTLYQRQKVAEIADAIIKKQDQELKARQIEAAGKAGAAAPAAAGPAVGPSGATPVLAVQAEDVIVNPVAGTITVNGNEKQHRLVQDYLVKVETGAQRQVLIEATIVEVGLSDAYQGGIDWSRLVIPDARGISNGISLTQSMLGAGNFAPGNLTVGYINSNSPLGNIASTIKLLDQFGSSRVLSSPKLMVLNNQTALLKAVDNLVYFDIQAQTTTSTTGPALTTFTTTAKNVSVGIVMGVTPQVNEDGRVLLTVRPTVSRQLTPVQDPNPSLCSVNAVTGARTCINNLVPQIQVREMESVLQVGSGQTVVLGGLMQDNAQRSRNSVPGAGNPANTGPLSELFAFRNDSVTKSELVVFIRPTVIVNPTLESDELKFYQRFLPQQSDTTTTSGERAGAAK